MVLDNNVKNDIRKNLDELKFRFVSLLENSNSDNWEEVKKDLNEIGEKVIIINNVLQKD